MSTIPSETFNPWRGLYTDPAKAYTFAATLMCALSPYAPIRRNNAVIGARLSVYLKFYLRSSGENVNPARILERYLSLRPEGSADVVRDVLDAEDEGVVFESFDAVIEQLRDGRGWVGDQADANWVEIEGGGKRAGDLVPAWQFVLSVFCAVVKEMDG